jgi:GrpB-like predicted nucleotidyltransferase (UPF0157 family)
MLGLKRGTVNLVPHNPQWVRLFEQEKQLLQETFGELIIAIEHIGSTAIAGIPAKPIIDMNIAVDCLDTARAMKEKFAQIGYEHRPFVPGHTKEDLQWQELYVKGPEAKRTHHAHVTVFANDYWNNDLLFRDYLRRHPERAKEYAALKERLAKQYANDRDAYTNSKQGFITETLALASR